MLCDAAGFLVGSPVGLAGGTVRSAWVNAQWLAHWAEATGRASPTALFARGLGQGLWGAAAGAAAGFGVWLVMDDDLALDAAIVLVTGFGLVGWSLAVPVAHGMLAFEPDAPSPAEPAPVLMPPFGLAILRRVGGPVPRHGGTGRPSGAAISCGTAQG